MFEAIAGGRVRVFERPKPGHLYCLTVDPSSGGEISLDDTKPGDDSALVVRDRHESQVVCTMRGRYPPYTLKHTVYLLALWYNHAIVAVENNAGWGTPILEYLYREKNYEEVYLSQRFDSTRGDYSYELGWNTNKKTRPLAFSTARGHLREGKEALNDPELIHQLVRMQYLSSPGGAAKELAPAGEKDDMALAWVVNVRVCFELGEPEPVFNSQDPNDKIPWHVREMWAPVLDSVNVPEHEQLLIDFEW